MLKIRAVSAIDRDLPLECQYVFVSLPCTTYLEMSLLYQYDAVSSSSSYIGKLPTALTWPNQLDRL